MRVMWRHLVDCSIIMAEFTQPVFLRLRDHERHLCRLHLFSGRSRILLVRGVLVARRESIFTRNTQCGQFVEINRQTRGIPDNDAFVALLFKLQNFVECIFGCATGRCG
jgi:hypothetical protein